MYNQKACFFFIINSVLRNIYWHYHPVLLQHHLRNIARIQSILSFSDTQSVIHACISCRLDYCSGFLTGFTLISINRLQTQNQDFFQGLKNGICYTCINDSTDFKILLTTLKALLWLASEDIGYWTALFVSSAVEPEVLR